ncbi:MAG: hypothetical protein WD673_13765 [Alphaproteobacteria bacterium]
MNNEILDDGILVAYVDGELDEKRRRKIEAALSEDADAADKVRLMAGSARLLRGAYDEVFDLPVAARLRAMLDAARSQPRMAARRGWLGRLLGVGRAAPLAVAAACAAALALGVFVGRLEPGPETTYVPASLESKSGVVLLEPQVRALETGADGVEIGYDRSDIGVRAAMTPLAAFAGPDGLTCRPYRDRIEHAAGPVTMVGIACRVGDGSWTALEFPAQ